MIPGRDHLDDPGDPRFGDALAKFIPAKDPLSVPVPEMVRVARFTAFFVKRVAEAPREAFDR